MAELMQALLDPDHVRKDLAQYGFERQALQLLAHLESCSDS
jgi:hypothetical protein